MGQGASHMAGVEHSFFYIWEDENVSRTDTHFLLVNMDCLLSLLSNTLFETQERQRFNYITFVSMQTRCVLFFFLLSGYGNRFFFYLLWEPIHEKRGVELFVCAYCVLRYICGKDIYSRLYFQRGKIAIYVVPRDNVC